MTLGTIIIIIVFKFLQSALPQWRRDVNSWIEEDQEGFLKFKKEVFATINSAKKGSLKDGYEIIPPKS